MSLTIGITGAAGLIGWHTRCFLETRNGVTVKVATHATFDSPAELNKFVSHCDAIIHCAGVNRGDTEHVESANPAIAATLIAALKNTSSTPHLIYTSSIHARNDTPYGRSKRLAHEAFWKFSDANNSAYTCLVLPHVFGEFGKPNYNSVVATFCHQLAIGERPEIHQDSDLELLHAQDVAQLAYECVTDSQLGEIKPTGRKIRVSELLEKLSAMDQLYKSHLIPDLRDGFHLRLFNTYRACLYPDHYPVSIQRFEDERGGLFEAVKGHNGGQTFLSTTKPGITRGDHFHFAKVERFVVVEGQAKICIRRLHTNQVQEFSVSGDTPVYIDMPPLCTHNITNSGDKNLLTLFWSHEIFDPEQPDTYAQTV